MIYVFRCDDKECLREEEITFPGFLQDGYTRTCSCGKIMNIVYFPPMVIYKGKGFYSTDNRDPMKGDKVFKKKQQLKEKYGNSMYDIDDKITV